MAFRTGVNLGDVIAENDTIHGDGVNIASRLEKLAEPGGVCISRNVYDQVKGKLAYAYSDLGEQRFHNIAEPVRAFRVRSTSPAFAASRAADALPLPDNPSIAVLPFTNMSGDPIRNTSPTALLKTSSPSSVGFTSSPLSRGTLRSATRVCRQTLRTWVASSG